VSEDGNQDYFKREELACDLMHLAGTLIITLAGSGAARMDWWTVITDIIDIFKLEPDTIAEVVFQADQGCLYQSLRPHSQDINILQGAQCHYLYSKLSKT
jgi:hypothetical protein